ncbi:MAG: DUF4097 family beta strand repeat-containing protein [Bryobacteraceae bacterium]
MRISLRAFPATAAPVVVLAACTAIATYAATEGHFDRTLRVNGTVNLDVQTGAGGIEVRQGGSATVEIHGIIRTSADADHRVHYLESHPPIEQNGNTIRIGHIEDRDLTRNISISYDLTVPAETELHSASGSGSENIEGIRGPVDASSGSGTITLRNIGSEVRVRAGSGDITLNSIHGSAQANTGSGSIQANEIAGGFTGNAGSGGIHLQQTAAGDVNIGTGSGSIEISGAVGAVRAHTGSGNLTAQGRPKGNWNLRTGSGNLEVTFPPQAAYDLVAHAGSGGIHMSQTVSVQGTANKHELHGKVHGGGSVVDLSTGSGSIRIN